ncbi:MAG: hypothetical protein GXX94_04370 [Chloroflexi bacterium]|nr:hypothetical protein [Chloroflexota bacterium]
MASRRMAARYEDLPVRRVLLPAHQPAPRHAVRWTPARRQALARLVLQRLPAAAPQLAPLIGHLARTAMPLGCGVRRSLEAGIIRRDRPPTLSSRPIEQTGALGYQEWEAEHPGAAEEEEDWEEERQASDEEAGEEAAEPHSEPPSDAFVEGRATVWAEAIAAEIRERLEQAQAAASEAAPGESGAGAPGDPAWLDEVVEQLTGVAYERAHRWYGGQSAWRREYAASGDYPLVAVCDQLGELIQYIRGIENYGGGLTIHMEHYLGAGELHAPPVIAQPGVTLFHVMPSSAGHALNIDPGKRVPLLSGWSREDRRAARAAEGSALGEAWSTAAVSAARQNPARAEDVRRADELLDAVYERDRFIQHETTIIRTSTGRGGATRVQLFDFEQGIAQEGPNWRGLATYNNASEYLWGYLGEGATRALARPRGTGTITISLQGRSLQEIPLNREGAGPLLPLGRYIQLLRGLPYTDVLDLRLAVEIDGHPSMEMSVSGAGQPRMQDLTPPH